MGCGESKPDARREPSLMRNTVRKSGPDTYKVVLLGDKAVGKSSIVLRYTQDKFSETHALTIGAAFVSKDLSLSHGSSAPSKTVRLHIWDTAGEEAYRSMTRFFFRDAAAAVVVYDVSSRASFANVESWIRDFHEQCPDSLVVLAGNKCDVPDRAVSVTDLSDCARRMSLDFLECSAKENRNINELFALVARKLDERASAASVAASRSA